MRCAACGHDNLPDARFCVRCGRDLRGQRARRFSPATIVALIITVLVVVTTGSLVFLSLTRDQPDVAATTTPNEDAAVVTPTTDPVTLTFGPDGIASVALQSGYLQDPVLIEAEDGTLLAQLAASDFHEDGTGKLVASVQLALDASGAPIVAHVRAGDYVGTPITLNSAPLAPEEDVVEPQAPAAPDQLSLIAAHRGTWQLSDDGMRTGCAYAVSDLDHDGLLEVIAARMGGTGRFTDSYVWEATPACDGLERRFATDENYTYAPDWPDAETATYHADGRYVYILHDIARAGWMDSGDGMLAMTAEAGADTWDFQYLGRISYHRDSQGEDYTVTHFDAADNVVSEADYDALPDRAFAGMARSTTAIQSITQDELDADAIGALTRSWQAFSLI